MRWLNGFPKGGVRRPDRAIQRILAALLCTTVTGIGLACGDDSTSGPPERVSTGSERQSAPSKTEGEGQSASPNIVTRADLEAKPAGSPERALLSFFQAVQFRDTAEARALVSAEESKRLGSGKIRAAIAAVGGALGKPQFVATNVEGNRASIRVLVLGFEADKTEPSSSSPILFKLRKEDGGWKLSDLAYLIDASDAITESQRGTGRDEAG